LRFQPRTLFGRSALTIALSLVVFMVLSLGSAIYFIAMPMAKRSADDFAAVIVSAAHSLQSLPEEMHAELKQRLLWDHGLIVTEHVHVLSEKSFDVPYYIFFEEALARRAGRELHIFEEDSGLLIWVDVPAHEKMYRMGFNRERLGTNPPIVLLTAIGGGALLTWFVSLFEVRRVSRPLARLSAEVEAVGRGSKPAVLPEHGPKEIAALARAFNQMSFDVQELADNRTVLVAGISHDLRTPLTRLGLAVEMLDENTDPQLVAGIRRDLDAMNRLIGQFLDFSKGLANEQPTQLDLRRLLEAQVADLKRGDVDVNVSGCDTPCPYTADPVALQRLLANLLENAAQYGGGESIDVELLCDGGAATIRICDRGPGIPAGQAEAVFRPFHRLESARSTRTGGSGLGLAIARQLAIGHGWTVELLPRDGGGTVANVKLPRDR